MARSSVSGSVANFVYNAAQANSLKNLRLSTFLRCFAATFTNCSTLHNYHFKVGNTDI